MIIEKAKNWICLYWQDYSLFFKTWNNRIIGIMLYSIFSIFNTVRNWSKRQGCSVKLLAADTIISQCSRKLNHLKKGGISGIIDTVLLQYSTYHSLYRTIDQESTIEEIMRSSRKNLFFSFSSTKKLLE